MSEQNEGVVVAPEANENGDSSAGSVTEETVSVKKTDYDKLNETLGSLKRELKDLKKSKEAPAAESQKPDASTDLTVKAYLRSASITDADEVELALTTAKKWDMPIDKLVDDEDFQAKLSKLRTTKANENATSNIRGDGKGKGSDKGADFYINRGTPPTPDEVPDRKTRSAITRKMMDAGKGGGNPYYNGK